MIPRPLDFVDYVRSLERRIRDLESSSALRNAIGGLIGDWVTSGLNWSMKPDWTMTQYAVCRRAGSTHLILDMVYSGSDVTFGSGGDTTNVDVLRIPSPYVPYDPIGILPLWGHSWNSDLSLLFTFGSGGALRLAAGWPGGTLSTNDTVRIYQTYPST